MCEGTLDSFDFNFRISTHAGCTNRSPPIELPLGTGTLRWSVDTDTVVLLLVKLVVARENKCLPWYFHHHSEGIISVE